MGIRNIVLKPLKSSYLIRRRLNVRWLRIMAVHELCRTNCSDEVFGEGYGRVGKSGLKRTRLKSAARALIALSGQDT